jgi:hypothetical protein
MQPEFNISTRVLAVVDSLPKEQINDHYQQTEAQIEI